MKEINHPVALRFVGHAVAIAAFTLICACNPAVYCTGDCENGHGTRHWWTSGMSCESDFINGDAAPSGVLVDPRVGTYRGDISQDCMANGVGTITFHSGDTATGTWHWGKLDGEALYITAKGERRTVKYEKGQILE